MNPDRILLDAAFMRQRAEFLCSQAGMKLAMGSARVVVRPLLSEAVKLMKQEHMLYDDLHAAGFWDEVAQ